MMSRFLCFGFILGFILSCGDDDGADPVSTASASCELPAMATIYDMCHDFTDWPSTSLSAAKSDCEGGTFGAAGTWAEGSVCSTTGSLGTCSWSSGSNTIVTVYTAATGATAATSKLHCENTSSGWGGTWTDAS